MRLRSGRSQAESAILPRRHDACELPDRALGLRKVVDREVAHEGVERALLERELLGVALQEADPGMTAARECDDLVGDVHARRDSASLVPRRAAAYPGPFPTSSTHMPAADTGRVEQRLHEPRGDLAGEAAVGLGLRVPTGPLERLEGLGVAHLTHYAGQKSSTISTSSLRCPMLVDAIRSTASSGPSFQTERTVCRRDPDRGQRPDARPPRRRA